MTNINNGAFTFLGQNIQIDPSWDSFFQANQKTLQIIENKLSPIMNDICPTLDLIFRVFEMPIKDIKVVILGLDPYHQKGVATGLAFDVNKPKIWDKYVSKSLSNILKEVYALKSGNKSDDINTIRANTSKYNISTPNQLIKKWETNGVFMLNVGLTVKEGKPKSNLNLWKIFIGNVISYIDTINNNLECLVWGQNDYQKEAAEMIINSKKVFFTCHPVSIKTKFVGNSKIQKINQYQKIFY
ncbi:uracil-DNA glycosylase family protein [Flammeovirga sp. OC4]|uniref:uracil-DNA glycosylase family protein n=1 Tax=Flammeovirga sp. OC4 TaxID=1382345 RepID=UPI0006943E75|nr:uracil-DNA glycosylase family protein [Flammeovirga sp. OC4]